MPEPRVGIENLLWFVRVFTVVWIIGGLALVLIMRRRDLPLRRKKWAIALFVGFNMALFMWLIGFGLLAALIAGVVAVAIGLAIVSGVDAVEGESGRRDEDD